jgi:hypothetical protein
MRAYRWSWRVVVGGAGVVLLGAGAIVLPMVLWVVLACLVAPFGLILAIGTGTATRAGTGAGAADGPRGRRLHVAKVLVGSYLVLVACAVLFKLLGSAAFGVLTLVFAASPPAIGWYGRRLARGRDEPMPQATVSTEQLCREWLDSYAALNSAPTSGARQRCLDELERRDPAGLQAWLASSASAGRDPRRYLTDSDGGGRP